MKLSPRTLVILVVLNLLLLGGVVYVVTRQPIAQYGTTAASPSHTDTAMQSPKLEAPAFAQSSDDFSGRAATTSAPVQAPPVAVSAPPVHVAQATPVVQDTKSSIPAIFIEPDSTLSLSLTPDQLEAFDNLRQKFVEEVGQNSNPNDPEYLRRWQLAQPKIDLQLRALLGSQVYSRLQQEAARQQSNLPDQ